MKNINNIKSIYFKTLLINTSKIKIIQHWHTLLEIQLYLEYYMDYRKIHMDVAWREEKR